MVKAKIDYSKSKVYKIYCPTEPSLCYIGSTTKQYLSQRMDGHRSKYKTCKKSTTSYLIFDKYGIENCIIELIELYPCFTVEELRKREGYYIQNNNCVNINVPTSTINQKKDIFIPDKTFFRFLDYDDYLLILKQKYYDELNYKNKVVIQRIYNKIKSFEELKIKFYLL